MKHSAYKRISAAAKALDEQRERWLNPPEWVGPLAARVDEEDDFSDVPLEARGLVRGSAIAAACAKDARLKKRTLTNLYNERPTWLKLAHLELDRAVLGAYGAVDKKGGWEEGWAEVWEEGVGGSDAATRRGGGGGDGAKEGLGGGRGEVDRRVLENLLRLNGERAGG